MTVIDCKTVELVAEGGYGISSLEDNKKFDWEPYQNRFWFEQKVELNHLWRSLST